MAVLEWDRVGERLFETGVDHGVLYIPNAQGSYANGVAWNGLVSVSESPSGAEASPQYADNGKYLNLYSAEDFGATIEAFTYPKEFLQFDGMATLSPGINVGQQTRKPFGLGYRSRIGNDLLGADYGYKLHLVYGCMASPSERAYSTINDSPEAITLSWELSTTPVAVPGHKASAILTIDSTEVPAAQLAELEAILYGTAGSAPRLPLPAEIMAIFEGTTITVNSVKPTQVGNVLTIPTITGVTYEIDNEPVVGDVTITEDVVVVAKTAQGYKFPDVSDNDWLFESV